MTQASSQIATAPPDLVRKKPGTVGAPLPGVEVRIDEGGEIFVRGATIARGYSGSDPEQGFVDAVGWLRTGDLGWLDEEGHLWVTGRLSERIITGGVNVDPGEVERVLRTHPAVEDASVIGLADPEWGERVVAALEPVSGETPTLQEVEEFVRERLSAAKRPRQWLFVELIPRNPNGKVNRLRLEELFVERRPGE
jgi:O-succinylbenzoic acid--CoA ligase